MVTPQRKEKLLSVLKKRQTTLTIVLENVHDPHNISAVLRTCDAVGINEIYVINNQISKSAKLGKKSSASAIKWVKVINYKSAEECIKDLKNDGFMIFSTFITKESKSLFDLNLTEKIALVFGNEHDGVSQEIVTLSDVNFSIPQVGMIPSLNISVACAICLYESYRQRSCAGLYDVPQFSQKDIEKIFNEFAKI